MRNLLFVSALLFFISGFCFLASGSDHEADTARIEQSLRQMPLYFIENQGQLAEEVRYYVQGINEAFFFQSDGLTLTHTGFLEDQLTRWAVKMNFINNNPAVSLVGERQLKGRISYFKGSPNDWKAGMATFGSLVYRDLWPDIDLVYSGAKNRLKYQYIVHPGADPSMIGIDYQGVKKLTVAEDGKLQIQTPVGCILDGKPFAYQVVDGKQIEIPMSYAVGANPQHLGFEVGAFDPSLPLILDPEWSVYCGYLGGERKDDVRAIVVDQAGNAYLTGWTLSTELTFPVVTGPDLTFNTHSSSSATDAFVAKIDASGAFLHYCGYIGGDYEEKGYDIVVDELGCAYLTGMSISGETGGFPVLVGPDLTYNGGMGDAFVAKVSADGTYLEYCGFVGGNKTDMGFGIALDVRGCVLITGTARSSPGGGFPVRVGPDLTYNGGYSDCFVAKVKADGTALQFCGYIGGTGDDAAVAIAVDRKGRSYVGGYTGSNQRFFPVTGGPDLSYNGGYVDGFVAGIDQHGKHLLFCGYIGGAKKDYVHDLSLNTQTNSLYLTGSTESNERTFPVCIGPELVHKGNKDVFVAKVNITSFEIDYCGFIGGMGNEKGLGITTDNQGNAYITGETSSFRDFPLLLGPDLTFNGGPPTTDAFLTKVAANGSELIFSGYWGGDLQRHGNWDRPRS